MTTAISAAAIAKPASKRFALVRVSPARWLASNLVWEGGTLYTCTMTGAPVTQAFRQGVALTQVASGSVSTVDTWSYDVATGKFEISLTSPASNLNNVVVYYDLYYTSTDAVEWYATPTDSTTPWREWQPKLVSEPTVQQTVQDTTIGVMTIGANDIQLYDADRSLRSLLTQYDTLNQREISIWICVDTPSNCIYAFKGVVSQVRFAGPTVTLSVLDGFASLRQPAFMGDTADECIFAGSTSSFPNADINRLGEPVRMFLGRYSWRQTQNKMTVSGITVPKFVTSESPKAVCTSYSSSVSTTTNRTWTLGRVSSAGLRTWGTGLGAYTSVLTSGSIVLFGYSGGGVLSTDVAVGDCVQLSQGGQTTRYGWIATLNPTAIQVVIENLSGTPSTFTSGVTITALSTPMLMIHDTQTNSDYFPVATEDYTASATTTSGGNKRIDITFNNSFESSRNLYPDWASSGTALTTLDPARHEVYFYMLPAMTALTKHADVLQAMMTSAGMAANASSFTAANSALSANCLMSIPYSSESTFGSYLSYAQDICEATIGILYLDTAQQVNYSVVSAPSATNKVDANTYLRDTLTVTIDYLDIYSTIAASNPHQYPLDLVTGANQTITNPIAVYLHGVKNVLTLVHPLESITPTLAKLSTYRGARRATYVYDTATNDLNTVLGDNWLLSGTDPLGGVTSVSLKTIGTQKSAASTEVTATDYLGT